MKIFLYSESPEILLVVDAPHFYAGLILRNGRCVRAAPILQWAVGKSAIELAEYFVRKRWRVVRC